MSRIWFLGIFLTLQIAVKAYVFIPYVPCFGVKCKPVHGQWGSWGSWSTCGGNCKKSRSRSCNNPAPIKGGKYCYGASKDEDTCSGGQCIAKDIGVLITGGLPSSRNRQVNLYNLVTKEICSLPNLPEPYWDHSSVSGVVCCGGPKTKQQASCTYWKNGSWHFTGMGYAPSRIAQVSWNINPGVSFMMFGGYWGSSYKSGVSVPIDGPNKSLVKGIDWKLKYSARYSCSMEVPEEDKLMIAGGVFAWGATTRVTKYDKFGNFEEMPSMKTGRGNLACGSYLNGNQQRVYLVVGGSDGSAPLSSTEILSSGSGSWQYVGQLPISVRGIRAVNFDNNIYAFGGNDGKKFYSDIYQFNPATGTWASYGTMNYGKSNHAIEVVNFKEYSQYCVA